MRAASLVLIAALALGACSFGAITPPASSPIQSLDRAEEARAREARMHPDCRDSRQDRHDQSRACRVVVRRGE